jgi:hypothetical protein
MSDDATKPPSPTETKPASPLSVTVNQLHRFMDAKFKTPICEACGVDGWMIPLQLGLDESAEQSYVQMAALPGIGIDGSFPVHTLVCKDCGNVRLLSAITVRQWIDENA